MRGADSAILAVEKEAPTLSEENEAQILAVEEEGMGGIGWAGPRPGPFSACLRLSYSPASTATGPAAVARPARAPLSPPG